MLRVRLIHWNPKEAKACIAALRAAGYAVDFEALGPGLLGKLKEQPPAAVVIDLSRLPSHGRDVALVLREQKSTRHIPLVFAEGAPEKVARVRASLPDAVFTDWKRIRGALRGAIAHPSAAPVVPSSRLAGYSGTPLPKKLDIRENFVVALVKAPSDLQKTLGKLPAGVRLRRGLRGRCDRILWFVRSRRELTGEMKRMAQLLGEGAMWIFWVKKASGAATDVAEPQVRETGLAAGLVDYKICALDATWSGLLFRRRKHKPR